MSTINVKDASGNTVSVNTPNADGRASAATSRSVCLANEDKAAIDAIATSADTESGKMVVGTARDRFFDNFFSWDTTDTWEVIQIGSGQSINGPLGGAVNGSSPWMQFVTGVTANAKTVVMSRQIFKMPVELRFAITASQRIANHSFRIGFVEVDPVTGSIITSTAYASGALMEDARNGFLIEANGTVATTFNTIARSAGSAQEIISTAFGATNTTVATGSSPNFIYPDVMSMQLERDRTSVRHYDIGAAVAPATQFIRDAVIPNPTKTYKLIIIMDNGATPPASTTDFRLHMVNVLDCTRFDVSPRYNGTDQNKAFPVVGNVAVSSLPTLAAVTTVTTVTGVTNAGTPAAPATPYILNSLASTNEVLILTGTSGLHAFYATNTGASAAFVKLYNKATAPTSSDIPAMIIPVPAAVSGVPGVATLPIGFNGFRFALGLGIRITGGVADNDTTAVAAGQVKVMLSRTV